MPELIDKQASMKAICDGCFKSRAVDLELRCRGTCNVIDILQQQPTIDAEPVKPALSDDDHESGEVWCENCDHIEMCKWYPTCGCEFRQIDGKPLHTIKTTGEAESVRRGRWIEKEHYHVRGEEYCDCECSICCHRISRVRGYYPNYCEECGSMNGGDLDVRNETN